MPSEVSIRAVLQGFDQARSSLSEFSRGFDDLGKSVTTASSSVDDFGNKWTKNMSEAEQATARFNATVQLTSTAVAAGLGAATAYAADQLFGAFKRISEGGEQLFLMSQRTGIAAESLSELGLAAKVSGLTLDDVGHSMERFSRAVINSKDDSDQTGGAFQRLGINVKGVTGELKSNEVLMGEVADAFERSADGAAKTEIAIALFGRAGAQMIPILNQGAAGLDSMRDAAKKANIVLGEDSVKAAHDLHESWAILGAFADGFWNKVATPVVSGMAEIAKAMADARVAGEGFFASLWAGLRTTDLLRDRRQDEGNLNAEFMDLAAPGLFDSAKKQLPGKDQTDKRIKDEQDTAKALIDIREASLYDYMAILQRQFDAFSDDGKRRVQIRQEMVKVEDALGAEQMQQTLLQTKALEDGDDEQLKNFRAAQAAQRKEINDTAAIELAQIQATAYWTREDHIKALQELADKYSNTLAPGAEQAYQRIQVAIARTRDDTEDFQRKLVQAFGPSNFSDVIINGLKGVRTDISTEFAAVLKGQESFTEALSNLWKKLKDRIIDTLAELAVNSVFNSLVKMVTGGSSSDKPDPSFVGPPAPPSGLLGALGITGPMAAGLAAGLAIVLQLGTAEGRAQFIEFIKGIPQIINEFIKHLPEVIDAVVRATPKIMVALTEAIVIGLPAAFAKAAGSLISEMAKGAAPFLGALLDGLGKGLADMFRALLDGLRDGIKKLFQGIAGAAGIPGIGGGSTADTVINTLFPGAGSIAHVFGLAHGGDSMVTRPTLFMAGEAGAEHVSVRSAAEGRGGRGGVYVDMRGAIMDSYSTRLWQRQLGRELARHG